MADLQNEQKMQAEAASSASTHDNSVSARELVNRAIGGLQPPPYSPYWTCCVTELHRECCWSFLTQAEKRAVFDGMKAQKEQDKDAFVKAIAQPRPLKMIALINTLTDLLYHNTAKVLQYGQELARLNHGKIHTGPFQHQLEYRLHYVPGVDIQKIIGDVLGHNFEEASAIAKEAGLESVFDHNSTVLYPLNRQVNLNTKAENLASQEEDLDPTQVEESATSKKKRKNRNRRQKAKMGNSQSVAPAEEPVASSHPTVDNATEALTQLLRVDDVPDNESKGKLPAEKDISTSLQADNTATKNETFDAPSSCGATLEDSIPDPLDIPCRRAYNDWPSVAIDPYIDFFKFPVNATSPSTYVDGPDDPKDKRTIYNYHADKILGEVLEFVNAENPFTPAETVPGPALGELDYGDADYGMYSEVRVWLGLD